MEEDMIRRKAELILGGAVRTPQDWRPPVRISRSTAGPGAGTRGLVFRFSGMRVKKPISSEDGEFELQPYDGGLRILRDGEVFIDPVEIEPVIYHSPGQAFFNLDQRCDYHCLFCTSPSLGTEATKNLTPESISDMVAEASERDDFVSVALTSGVVGSVEATVERMVRTVSLIRERIPWVTIGVEPYVENEEQLWDLRDAGADEMKINIETPDADIFAKVCPELDHANIHRMIEAAVDIFGRGKVSSNIIIGLGESDEQVIEEVRRLADIGCAAGLRPLKVNDSNRSVLENALGTLNDVDADRLIRLGREQKSILEEHGLDTRTYSTMCFECGCCDLVPFKDF